jgi:hypothetical protein
MPEADGGELISREALDRILRRATELQAQERDIGDGLTREEVLALGNEVGIPPRYLQHALLEEQTRGLVEERGGLLGWLVGPERLSAQRVVPGDRAAVERALGRWMETEESLQVKRRYADRTTWEPRVGAFASIQRALGAGGRRYALARAVDVAGQVTQLESGFCHVQLLADVRNLRKERFGIAAMLLATGVAATGAFLAMAVLVPFAYLPAAVFAPAAVVALRRHRAAHEQIQIGLEQVLDRLERGEIKPEHALPGTRVNAFVRIADEIRTLMNPGSPPRA